MNRICDIPSGNVIEHGIWGQQQILEMTWNEITKWRKKEKKKEKKEKKKKKLDQGQSWPESSSFKSLRPTKYRQKGHGPARFKNSLQHCNIKINITTTKEKKKRKKKNSLHRP